MYPFIQIGDIKIYMTGIGIVVSILAFIYLIRYFSKRFNLDFWKFFNRIPIFLISSYLLGSYGYYLIEQKLLFPVTLGDIMMILSPFGYKFSFIGLSIGFFGSLYYFINSIKIKTERQKRIDVFFYSFSISLVPLGIFLTFGDSFYGKQTDSYLSITPFVEESALSKYQKVYAIGLLLSIIGIFSFITTFLFQYVCKRHGYGIIGFMILIFLINIVFLLQNYPRHLVTSIFDITFDIKNYWTIILIVYLFWFNLKYNKVDY